MIICNEPRVALYANALNARDMIHVLHDSKQSQIVGHKWGPLAMSFDTIKLIGVVWATSFVAKQSSHDELTNAVCLLVFEFRKKRKHQQTQDSCDKNNKKAISAQSSSKRCLNSSHWTLSKSNFTRANQIDLSYLSESIMGLFSHRFELNWFDSDWLVEADQIGGCWDGIDGMSGTSWIAICKQTTRFTWLRNGCKRARNRIWPPINHGLIFDQNSTGWRLSSVERLLAVNAAEFG